MEGAKRFDVVIIPIGGGTSVSGALECPENEMRSICSLDMSLMDKIIYIDDENFLCRAQVMLFFVSSIRSGGGGGESLYNKESPFEIQRKTLSVTCRR